MIPLTPDFGLRDPYVGIMKGVVLFICPSARLVDPTHGIPPRTSSPEAWRSRGPTACFTFALDADRFGNLLTSVPAARLIEVPGAGGGVLVVAGRRLRGPVNA